MLEIKGWAGNESSRLSERCLPDSLQANSAKEGERCLRTEKRLAVFLWREESIEKLLLRYNITQ